MQWRRKQWLSCRICFEYNKDGISSSCLFTSQFVISIINCKGGGKGKYNNCNGKQFRSKGFARRCVGFHR